MATVVLVAAATADAAPITFFDGTFTPSDWTYTEQAGAGVSSTTTQRLTDGNPAENRETTVTWNPGVLTGTSEPSRLMHQNNTFTYDPSVAGAIAALTISVDAINVRSSFSTGLPYRGFLVPGLWTLKGPAVLRREACPVGIGRGLDRHGIELAAQSRGFAIEVVAVTGGERQHPAARTNDRSHARA